MILLSYNCVSIIKIIGQNLCPSLISQGLVITCRIWRNSPHYYNYHYFTWDRIEFYTLKVCRGVLIQQSTCSSVQWEFKSWGKQVSVDVFSLRLYQSLVRCAIYLDPNSLFGQLQFFPLKMWFGSWNMDAPWLIIWATRLGVYHSVVHIPL